MAEVRADPLTLRPGWRLLGFPFRAGTAIAALSDIEIRYAVDLDDSGAVAALAWLRVQVRDEPVVR